MIDEKLLIEEINMQISEIENDGSNAYYLTLRVAEHVKRLIKRQPKVGEWIPVSERLPEENIPVLTCDKTGWQSVNINTPYTGKKNDFECGYYVAWMPLPEPYKEGE